MALLAKMTVMLASTSQEPFSKVSLFIVFKMILNSPSFQVLSDRGMLISPASALFPYYEKRNKQLR